jgi:hypothetical protein
MDIVTLLNRIEKNFFYQLDEQGAHSGLSLVEVRIVKKMFSEAIKNVMITTYAVVMKDADKKGG